MQSLGRGFALAMYVLMKEKRGGGGREGKYDNTVDNDEYLDSTFRHNTAVPIT
jgi:hypothetical protein